MTSLQIAYMQAMEQKRHNLAAEAETMRSNLAQEQIGQRQADSGWRTATSSLIRGISGFLF